MLSEDYYNLTNVMKQSDIWGFISGVVGDLVMLKHPTFS